MDAGRQLTTLTRLGFAARGLLYIVIATVVLRSGRAQDPSEALQQLAQDGGRILLIAMTLGFVAYGLWRLSDAAFNIEGHEQGGTGLRERLGAAGSGVVHLFIAWQAIRLLNRPGAGGGGGSNEAAQTALQLPAGGLLLALAGLILTGVGIFQIIKAMKCSFCRKLDARVAQQQWVKWMGRGGYAARGVVFMISGYFVLRAGMESRASEAGGMDKALSWLDEPWNLVVAAGLLLFGLFSLVEARYRRIHDVPVDAIAAAGRHRLP